MGKEKAVAAKKVSKTFRQGASAVHALKEIDFDAYLNELLLIVGPSGCGKTTFLSVLAGTLRFDAGGEIEIFNQPLHLLKESQITNFRKKNVGFIFQQYHLIKALNCLENVSVPLLLNGMKKSEAHELSRVALENVGLKGREKEKPQNLSGGQQQRVAIARAIVHKPKLVICDEPTAALDEESGTQIMELLLGIARKTGHCVIIVTHDNRIFKYGDRIAKMNDGRMTSVQKNEIQSSG